MTSLTGKCLVASPHLNDPNFFRAVVYIVRHTEEEAFGFVLNRPSTYSTEKAIRDVCDARCVHQGNLYFGGPVEGPLFAIHDQSDLAADYSQAGVYWTADQQSLLDLFIREDAKMKVFDGYSGWDAGQLESELRYGGWLVTDVSTDEIFDAGEELWETLVHRVGHDILVEAVSSRGLLNDPSLN